MANHSVNVDSLSNAKSATLSRGHYYVLSFLLLPKYLVTMYSQAFATHITAGAAEEIRTAA